MKILFVLHGFAPELEGGTERCVEALARAMGACGHEVTVLCGSLEVASPDRVDEFDHAGLRVLRLHRDDLYFESWFKSYHPGVSRTLARLFRVERPDIVHVHHWLRLTSDIARLARDAGARSVVTAHDYLSVLARVVRRQGEDAAAPPPPAAWMTPSEAVEEFAVHRRDFLDELRAAHLLLTPSRAHAAGLAQLAPEGFPAVQVSPPPLLEVPQRLARSAEPGGRRLATWGSLYPDKGLDVLLCALRDLGAGWSLEVLGQAHDKTFEAELEQLAQGLDVRFRGAFTMAGLAALEADCAVLPSSCHESYGLVMDEAQALGLPVIAADLPAYREHCQPGSCAFFAPGDAASLATRLREHEQQRHLLAPKPPALRTAAAAAAELLVQYERCLTAAVDPESQWSRDPELERARDCLLFRRAERRLWSALQHGGLPLPPPDYPSA